MSPEKQRIKIAELMGWVNTQQPNNFLNSFDAIRAAIKVVLTQNAELIGPFLKNLKEVVYTHFLKDVNDESGGWVELATVEEYAEALLKTTNLWELE